MRKSWTIYSLVAIVLLIIGVKKNRLIGFIFHFIVFGQILPPITLFGYPFLRLLGIYKGPPNQSVSAVWTDLCCKYFNCKFKKIGDEPLYRKKVMYVCPHRSWSDFFVHRKIVDNQGSNLSRWMVLAAFPMFYIVTAFDKSVFWFNRSKARGNSVEFYKWLDSSLEDSYLAGVINYPEGTRNPTMKPKELKRGGIYYAYEYKVPVQVIMSRGNDDIINEKGLKMGFGKEIKYKYAPVTFPKDFHTREEFFNHIEKQFLDMWKEFY